MRTFDAKMLNGVANSPSVRPWLGGEGPIDLTDALADPNNFAFVNQWGGFVVMRLFEGRYECHSIFATGEGSGRDIARLMFESQEYMFTVTDCDELVTRVPDGNMAATGLARVGKFTELYRRGAVWGPDKKAVGYFGLSLDRWARLCSRTREAGHHFHDVLAKAKASCKSELPEHPEDELHDSIVGTTILMARAGNLVKGVRFFNRWASLAGYRCVDIMSIQPPVVDIGDAIIGLDADEVRVMLCR